MAFDPKRPYGQICGDSLGRKYEQDGRTYLADGTEYVDGGRKDKKPVRTPEAPVVEKPEGPVLDQLRAQLEG